MRTIQVPDDYKVNPLTDFIEKRNKRLTIVTTRSMIEKIKNEAKTKDISYSEIMNRALKMYFNEK